MHEGFIVLSKLKFTPVTLIDGGFQSYLTYKMRMFQTHTILSACKYLKYDKINLTSDAVFSNTSILIKVSKQQEILCPSQAKD